MEADAALTCWAETRRTASQPVTHEAAKATRPMTNMITTEVAPVSSAMAAAMTHASANDDDP